MAQARHVHRRPPRPRRGPARAWTWGPRRSAWPTWRPRIARAGIRRARTRGDLRVLDSRDPGAGRSAPQVPEGDPGDLRAHCATSWRGRWREGRVPVVLGGDHSIAMGTIAGVSRLPSGAGRRRSAWSGSTPTPTANTAETSPTGNIHGMPLAVVLGSGAPELSANLAGACPMVDGSQGRGGGPPGRGPRGAGERAGLGPRRLHDARRRRARHAGGHGGGDPARDAAAPPEST